MTVTPPKDPDHHQTDTAHGLTNVSSRHFQASSSPNHLAYGVYWRSRAGELLPVRRWRRRPAHALAHRMRYEDDVSVMVSGRPDFGERKTRSELKSQTSSRPSITLTTMRKHQLVEGAATELLWSRGRGRT